MKGKGVRLSRRAFLKAGASAVGAGILCDEAGAVAHPETVDAGPPGADTEIDSCCQFLPVPLHHEGTRS